MKNAIASIICAAGLLSADLSLAQMGLGNFAGGRLFSPQVIRQHRTELALTDEQNLHIRDVIAELQGEVSAIQWEMSGLVEELRLLLDEQAIDEDAVSERFHTLMALENDVKVAQLRMLVRIRNVLTPEQIEYLRALE